MNLDDCTDALTLDIYRISRCTHTFYDRKLKRLGIGMGQFPFMLYIAENDGISQEKLSEMITISKSTTATIVRQLMDMGLTTREIDAKDRRNFRLHLTQAGREIVPKIKETIARCHELLTVDMTSLERAIFVSLLEKTRARAEEIAPR